MSRMTLLRIGDESEPAGGAQTLHTRHPSTGSTRSGISPRYLSGRSGWCINGTLFRLACWLGRLFRFRGNLPRHRIFQGFHDISPFGFTEMSHFSPPVRWKSFSLQPGTRPLQPISPILDQSSSQKKAKNSLFTPKRTLSSNKESKFRAFEEKVQKS